MQASHMARLPECAFASFAMFQQPLGSGCRGVLIREQGTFAHWHGGKFAWMNAHYQTPTPENCNTFAAFQGAAEMCLCIILRCPDGREVSSYSREGKEDLPPYSLLAVD